MSGHNKWPPRGFRPARPEDIDRDEMLIVSLPPQVKATAEKPSSPTLWTKIRSFLAGHLRP